MPPLQRYALTLGVGANLVDPPEAGDGPPRPRVLSGLVPRGGGGRLYGMSAMSVGDIPEVGQPVVTGVGYDHDGLLAVRGEYDYVNSQVLYRLNYHGSLERTWLAGISVDNSTLLAFYEGAGLARAGVSVSQAHVPDMRYSISYLLHDAADGAIQSVTSESWSVTAASSTGGEGENGGLLSTETDGSRTFYLVVVRCIRTQVGLFGVGVMSTSVTLTTASEHDLITVTVDNTDGKRSAYAVYIGELNPEDAVGTVTDHALAGVIDATSTGEFNLEILGMPIGETLPDGVSGHLLHVHQYPFHDNNAAVMHQGRMYGISPGGSGYGLRKGLPVAHSFRLAGNQAALRALPPQRAVVYSAGLSIANLAGETGFFQPALRNSTKITALVSSPAGLLVFGDNETLVARGDPDSADFSVQVLSGSIGCDEDAKPAVLGGVVFVVHKGRVWAVSLGSGIEGVRDTLTDISAGMVTPERFETRASGSGFFSRGSFARVWADAHNQQVVCAADEWGASPEMPGESGMNRRGFKLWRYDLASSAWTADTHPYTPLVEGDDVLLMPTSEGTYYFRNPGFDGVAVASMTNDADIELGYAGLTLGDEGTRKLFRRVTVYAQGFQQQGWLDDAEQDPPTLAWKVYGAGNANQYLSGTITGEQVEPNSWVFTFPVGTVGNRLDLTLSGALRAPDAGTPAYLESPIVIEYQPRYRRGWKGVRE